MRGMKLIAGSGRSGTTWILDSLATANNLRPVFEPLHPYMSEAGERYAHRALTANSECPDLEAFLAEVCAGRVAPLWTKYRRQMRWFLPPPEKFSTRRDFGRTIRHWGKFVRDFPQLAAAARRTEPIVKCIRANLMLEWLVQSQGWKVVLVVRHPAAVIESELRGSWNAEFALDRFRKDETLHVETGGRYRSMLERMLTPIEALAARWVIENQWIVERAETVGYTVVHYEHLRSSPEVAWPMVVRGLGVDRMPNPALLEIPSQQSAPRTLGTEPLSRRTGWQTALTPEQLCAIQGVLDSAECDMYSIDNHEPRRAAAAAMPGKAARIAT